MASRASKLGRSVLDLDVDDSKFSSGLDKNKKKAKSWTDSLNKDVKKGIAQGIGIAGALGVAGAVSTAIGGVRDVVAGSINAAMEWESAFAGVRKTVDASESEFADLEGGIRDMAKEMPIAATELAGLAEAAGALGVAKRDIKEFTRVTALIGTTTDVSSDQAATSLGQLSNVLGLTNKDYERFGSTLVDLGNKGASTESQILEIASRAGAGAKLIGLATDETLAWSSAVANLGIEVEAGGSAIQKFFLDSAKAVSEGTDKLETYARVAGMTGAEFKRAFEEDASGALQTFLAGLGQLSQGEQLKVLSDLDFNDVRITRTLLGLAGNVDNLSNSLDVAGTAWEENSALAVEASKRFSTTESKLQVLGNRVNDLAITFGDDLLPALVSLATLGVEQLEMFAEEVGDTTQLIGYMTQVVAGHFGEQGDAINALADEMDEDFGIINDAVARYMSETGADLDEALAAVKAYGSGNTAATEEAGRAWEAYQKQVAVSTSGATQAVADGVAGSEAALLAGEDGIGDAADAAFDPISKEAAEAREAAVDQMSDMLKAISNLFESDDQVRDAWQALIDRMDDPYTEAERKADIFSQATIDNIRAALKTGDPLIVSDTKDLVNNMLAQIQTMEPGALASGEAVPPAVRDGMDSQIGALIDYVEQQTGIVLSELSLDEAEKLGLDGIFLYAQGMRLNAWRAHLEATSVAGQVLRALEFDASAGGWSIITSWVTGMSSAWNSPTGGVFKLQGITGHAARILGRSLPKEGALTHPQTGGESIGTVWWQALVGAIDNGIGAIETRTDSVAAALAGVSIPSASLSGVGDVLGMGAAAAGTNVAGSITNIYQLHVYGKPIVVGTSDDVLDEWARMERHSDYGAAVS